VLQPPPLDLSRNSLSPRLTGPFVRGEDLSPALTFSIGLVEPSTIKTLIPGTKLLQVSPLSALPDPPLDPRDDPPEVPPGLEPPLLAELPPPPALFAVETLGAAFAWACFWTGLPVFFFCAAAASAVRFACSAAPCFTLSISAFSAFNAATSAALAAFRTNSAAFFAALNDQPCLLGGRIPVPLCIALRVQPENSTEIYSAHRFTSSFTSPVRRSLFRRNSRSTNRIRMSC